MLRKVGFSKIIIDMVYRLVGNNWYSILLNGQPKGFLRSYRGLKQGDPLSPTFFILATKVGSRALKSLNLNKDFKLFRMPRVSPSDMIILCKVELATL